MHQKIKLTDYLDNLELSFPAATYSVPRPILREIATPAALVPQAPPSPPPAPSFRVSQTVISPEAVQPLLLQDTKEQVMIVDKSLISFVSGVKNLGTFLIESTNKIRHILFVKYSSDETELKYASGKLTLDQVVYGKIRSQIRKKLTGRLTEFVSEIPI